MPVTTESIASQLRDNDPTSYTLKTNREGLRIRGTNVVAAANTAFTITKDKKMRWRRASQDVRLLKTAGVLADSSAAPAVTDVSPSTSPNDQTTLITVTGTGFEAGATVKLVRESTGVKYSVTNFTRVSATSLTFTVPATLPASDFYGIEITDTQLTVFYARVLTVTSMTITDIDPETAANDSTEVVTVTGTNFYTGVTVELVDEDGVAATADDITRVGPTSVTFTVPVAVAAATYDVRLTNPNGATPVVAGTQLVVT